MDESQQYEKICQPQLNRIEKHVSDIYKILEGNGQNGLKVKVATHDERIQSLQRFMKWSLGIIATIFTTVVVFLLTR
jgi:hypothetical protein